MFAIMNNTGIIAGKKNASSLATLMSAKAEKSREIINSTEKTVPRTAALNLSVTRMTEDISFTHISQSGLSC